MAWDQYASAWVVALGNTHASRNDGEEDPKTATECADEMLRLRRRRFRHAREVPRRTKVRLH